MKNAMLRVIVISILGLSYLHCSGDEETPAPAHWEALFDGQSLHGWVERDITPGAWSVEQGELVISKPGYGRLRTEKMYRDFELQVDFLISENGNSGVGLRVPSEGDDAFTGMEIQIVDTALDKPEDESCGAVVDAIGPAQNAAKPAGEWNQYRIHLVGDTLNVWLNDIKIHDNEKLDQRGYIEDPQQPYALRDRPTTGFISLQNHGNPARFRNIRIKDLSGDPEPDGFVNLIDDNLSRWTIVGSGQWTIQTNGELVARRGPGYLVSQEEFSDFELRALAKVNEGGTGGVYLRTTSRAGALVGGYMAVIDNRAATNFTGCILGQTCGSPLITRDQAWFDYRIRAKGGCIQTWINGIAMVDVQLSEYQSGRIGLANSDSAAELVFRDVRIVDLLSE